MRKLLQLRFTFILVPAIILLLVFLSGFTGKTASAHMSGQHTMKSYENVLIKSGDTLGAIAKRYGTSVSKLCELNGITKTTVLRLGRSLRCS